MTAVQASGVYPVKSGDWVADSCGRVARVRSVYDRRFTQGETLVDLVIFDDNGNQLGRTSPPEGGPTRYEPACSLANWHRIARPTFPIVVRWLDAGEGRVVAGKDTGAVLPWRSCKLPMRRHPPLPPPDDDLRAALERIAAGDNDPRRTAEEALARHRRRRGGIR